MNDSLKIHQNEDGTFSLEWDKDDPEWKFLNNMSSREIQSILEQALSEDENDG